jgi:hypothetical protein
VPFSQAYDLETLQPTREWSLLYEEVFEDVRAMGLRALS